MHILNFYKVLYKNIFMKTTLRISPVLIALLFNSYQIFGQSLTPVYLPASPSGANSKGYYQYLPSDYNSTTKNYPLLIWIHGAGQTGAGNTADLPKVLWYGLPNIIQKGGFINNFNVNGENFSFIVISPQFQSWPNGNHIAGILNHLYNRYRIDRDRIYLMGMSAGGGAIWQYISASKANADNVAAVLPLAGTVNSTVGQAQIIAASNLPVWAVHNSNDAIVNVNNSRNWIRDINSFSPNPAARLTEFQIQSTNREVLHDCWSIVCPPSYRYNGLNIYEWMLQYKKRTGNANLPPIARAGADQIIRLPQTTLTLNGNSSSDADGTIVQYNWNSIAGEGVLIQQAAQAQTNVTFPGAGVYTLELTVTDNNGNTGKDLVTVTVTDFPQSTQKIVNVNIFGGANPFNDSRWNNCNLSASKTSSTLNYEDGAPSGITAGLSRSDRVTDNGAGYGAAAVVCPQPVLRFASANTSQRTLTLSGMKPNATYTIEIYAGRASTGNSTVFTIGGSTQTLNTDNNVNNFALFRDVAPNSSGNITISISRIGTWTYVSGFKIKENISSTAGARLAATQIVSPSYRERFERQNRTAIVYPNPVANGFTTIEIKDEKLVNTISLLIDNQGREAGRIRITGMHTRINTSALFPGLYNIKLADGTMLRFVKLRR